MQLSDLISYSFASLLQDLKGHLGLLTQHLLCTFSDLKTVADVMEDRRGSMISLSRIWWKLLEEEITALKLVMSNSFVLQNLVAEVDNLCLKAEEEKWKVEEKHKQGHDALIMTLLVFMALVKARMRYYRC